MFLTIKLCTYAKLNCFKIEQIIYIKMDLALNNLQRLICHKTQQTNKHQFGTKSQVMSNLRESITQLRSNRSVILVY